MSTRDVFGLFTSTFKSDPDLIFAFTPAQPLLTLETTRMGRCNFAANLEKPLSPDNGKKHFQMDEDKNKAIAFCSNFRGVQNIISIFRQWNKKQGH